jgi:hypothetical protein
VSVRRYDFHGVRLEIDSAEAAVAEAIDGRLRHFRSDFAGEPDWRYALRIAGDGHVLARPDGEGRVVYDPPTGEVLYFAAGDVLWIDVEDRIRLRATAAGAEVSVRPAAAGEHWLLSRPLFTIPLVEALKRRGVFSLHASAAAHGDRVLLLPGTSGAGKSTLAVALAQAGWGFLADDMVFLAREEGGLRVYGFPDEVDLSPRSIAWFPALTPSGDPGDGWPKHRVRLQDTGWDHVAGGTPGAIAFPAPGPGEASELSPVPEGEALLGLAPNVLLTEPAGSQAHLDALAELVRDLPAYRLATGRDFDVLPGRLAALLRG